MENFINQDYMSTSLTFKKNFINLIGNLEYTNTEIARSIGIDYGIYKKIIAYGQLPKPMVLTRIADYFDISIDYLIGKTDDKYFEKANPPSNFITRYNELKQAYHYTDYKVAQKLHVSTSYTTAWKKHSYLPSLKNLIILSEIFQVSLDYLLGRTNYKF